MNDLATLNIASEICMSSFKNLHDGSQEYCDDMDNISGWTVYVRSDPDKQSNFDVWEEEDFPNYQEALDFTEELSEKYSVPVLIF